MTLIHGAPAPEISGTKCQQVITVTKFCMIKLTGPYSPPVMDKCFVTQRLKRDLFAIANLNCCI